MLRIVELAHTNIITESASPNHLSTISLSSLSVSSNVAEEPSLSFSGT